MHFANRKEIESITGESVVNDENFLDTPEKLKKKKKKGLGVIEINT